MMPSSASNGPDRGTPLRRWGPIAAIVAVLAVVAALVVTSGGDDEGTATPTTAATGETGGGRQEIEGAISFTEAEEQGLDVTYSAGCDEETGRIAVPYYFAAECFANVDDNGGATDDGVTADTIKIVVYLAPEQDAVLDFITAAIANDDTNAQVRATYEGYVELFEATYQTYGRSIELEFLEGSGQSTDEVAARADAVRAVEEMGAFAVWGSPALTNAWSEEIAARDVICIGCFGVDPPNPNVFTTLPSADQGYMNLAEYVVKKLAGQPAVHAGDEAMHETERVLGHLFIESSEDSVTNAEQFRTLLREGGTDLAEQLPYTLDPARLQEQATSIIARFKDAGVTTVIVSTDPIALATFTREATAQEYFPEWVIGPGVLVDTAAFGRTYDQEQWAHAFGLSPLGARTDPDSFDTMYEWYFGEEAPANDTEGVIWPNPAIFFNALQEAGPNLTTDTLRAGLYARAPESGSITAPSFSYGEHGLYPGVDQAGIDDFTEVWWDADEVGPDELEREGPGMYRYVHGGQRYALGSWPEDLRVFEEEGAVTIYTELPPSEADRVCSDCEPPG
jgi:hypothetical protein